MFVLFEAASVAILERLDLDGDGLTTGDERSIGTRPSWVDTDLDGLGDGWERRSGLDPLEPDTEGDGLEDGLELSFESDPFSVDSDNDGVPDFVEDPRTLASPDCDADGVSAIREVDDDNDERNDTLESTRERCQPDVDGDRILDGREGNEDCIRKVDCDSDGLDDGDELDNGFDPLNPDTFGIHLPDAIAHSFQQQGQPAGADADSDGIPDPWESETGLIEWGPYRPRTGQRDLLVEFVEVYGPDSQRAAALNAEPAFARVGDAFAQNGIRFQYERTRVDWPEEPLPTLLPTRTAAYYRAILDEARYGDNPYVLTVVLNPQLNQSELLHSGVAPLRGMLAAVDLGQRVGFNLRNADGNVTIRVTPLVEAIIRSNASRGAEINGGVLDNGRYFRRLNGSDGRTHTLEWTPFWYKNPRLIHATGVAIPLIIDSVSLDTGALASTIMHEIGHSLGLCHTHVEDCQRLLPQSERALEATSSMSYNANSDTVAYLPGEWQRVQNYLACPPPEPIRRLSAGSTRDQLLDSKYAYNLEASTDVVVRQCGDFQALERSLAPFEAPAPYRLPDELRGPPPALNDESRTRFYMGGSAGLALVAAFLPVLLARLPRRFGA